MSRGSQQDEPFYSAKEQAEDLSREKAKFARQEPLGNYDDGMSLIYAVREERTVSARGRDVLRMLPAGNGDGDPSDISARKQQEEENRIRETTLLQSDAYAKNENDRLMARYPKAVQVFKVEIVRRFP